MLGIPGYNWDLWQQDILWSFYLGIQSTDGVSRRQGAKSEHKILMTVGLHCKAACRAKEVARELVSGQGGPFVSLCRGTCSNESGFSVPWKVNSKLSLLLQGQVTPGDS